MRATCVFSLKSKSYRLVSPLLHCTGVVRPGYGRGSKTLGFPTANLPDFDAELREHPVDRGVYYGWASIQGEKGLYPCVSNIGISPTFVGEVRDVLRRIFLYKLVLY